MGKVERGIRADLRRNDIDPDDIDTGAMVALACSLARALDALDGPTGGRNADKERTGAASIARELRMVIAELNIGEKKGADKLTKLANARAKRKGS